MSQIYIDKLVRSKRKTVSLIVDENARLIIRAPLKMPMKKIKQIVDEKGGWILNKQEETRRKLSQKERKRFSEGEKFLYLGDEYPLLIRENCPEPLSLDLFNFILDSEYHKYALNVFEWWYRNRAIVMFYEKARAFSAAAGLRFAQVKLSRARRRWGSCSSGGNLNINWRLIMAPPKVIDYIMAHEVAHLREMNHSPRFWRQVEAIMPDYRDWKDWLNENGHLLEI